MGIRNVLLGALATAGLAGAMLTAVTPGAAQAAEGCTTKYPKTAAVVTLRSRAIELRYNSQGCAWGRILRGSPGDLIWVDRSFDRGRTWQPHLGIRQIDTGGSQHTEPFNNKGNLIRACGKVSNYPEVHCTTWR
ncbi:hypothetical protein M8C13_00880 [Crossiella sp. SN42]|uniref:hypothetical protein n=1 Tax=Crossiella sp. SN42 TaxID=2944808 RepID=UPI00207D0048|nr:hypothetical protein [Crossiella sp. SN42]MCO1574311.1 hypothetical protein [Crossiella sp. SN42]